MNFKKLRQAPEGPYLSNIITKMVPFAAVDAMAVVWHGHYSHFFEEGREALGRQFQISFNALKEKGFLVPVVHMSQDFYAPLHYEDLFELETRLYKREQPILETFSIIRHEGEKTPLVTAHTVQIFTALSGEPLLTMPPFLSAFYEEQRENFHGE